MFRAQSLQASDPLVDVHASVGDTHADVLVGGGDGNVLTAGIDDLAGINADIDVNGHVALGALGDGVGVEANVGLDGALINAAASVDGSLIDSASLGDCGC